MKNISFFIKCIRFAFRSLLFNRNTLLSIIPNFFSNSFIVHRNYFSDQEFLDLLENGRSLIRLGDGEISIINGKGICFQKYHKYIKEILEEIIDLYSYDSNYLLAIPKKYLSMSNKELRSENKLHIWLPFKIIASARMYDVYKYADSHLFYYDYNFHKFIMPILEGKHVIIITNNKTRSRLLKNSDKMVFSYVFVLTKDENAFDDIERLRYEIALEINKSPLGQRLILLVSCGPTGKVLIYEFGNQGIQGIDIGTGAEVLFLNYSIDWLV